jgi:PAS domain S-box-containing protein
MNPDLSEKLAQAFGLGSAADVEPLVATLRAGGDVDIDALRRGVLALIDDLRESNAGRDVSDERLKVALGASGLGLWEWDVGTNEVKLDATCYRFMGRDAHDAGWKIAEIAKLVHPDDREPFTNAMRDVLRGVTPRLQIQHRVQHSDGRWVWLETYGGVTERDANGRCLRMTGTHADITERMQLQRALSNTLRVMQALLETLPLPVIIRDADRRVTLVNAAFEKMTGAHRDTVVGRTLDAGPMRPAPRNHHETDDELFATKRPLSYETVLTLPDGRAFSVIVAKTPLLAEDGTVTGIASVITDISEQKRMRDAAEAAMHAKSRFLANMSHELRTPLNGVVGMASLLENTALDARQRRFVRTLKSSAEALITLINDVLDLSKAEAGKLELSLAPVDLRREIEQVVALFAARAHGKGIELAAHIAPGAPATAQGDPVRLRQVLGNLVNNAVKFTDSGAVLLSVASVMEEDFGPMLEFSVTDTGMGIEPAQQRRVFEAFEQADGSVTRKFGGTGLGLTISRQLIELMNGTMKLESEPGRGSRFSFRIPLRHADAPRATAAPPADTATLLIGLHALVRDAVKDVLGAPRSLVCCDSAVDGIEALGGLDTRIRRVTVIIDACATAKLEATVAGLRAAAAPRPVEVIALLPPDADSTPPPGVNRCLLKPLVTADLAVTPPAVETAQTLRVRALPASASRGRALVVEDNAVNQEMARAMLDMLGFEVLTASNGQEGVQVATANPDLVLILMDCQMPVMDGLAAASAIRAAETGGARVPIVALTGNAMPGDREACVAAGMDDYLAKPFSLTALRAMIDRWTGKPADARIA